MEVMETAGQRIKHLRMSRHMTGQQLADMLGVSRPHITQIEGGKKGVSADLLRALEQTTGVSADWILFGRGEMYLRDTEEEASSASTQDLDEFMRLLAGRHPDIVLHLRNIIKNQQTLTDRDRRALADLIFIAIEQASDTIKNRVTDADTKGI